MEKRLLNNSSAMSLCIWIGVIFNWEKQPSREELRPISYHKWGGGEMLYPGPGAGLRNARIQMCGGP